MATSIEKDDIHSSIKETLPKSLQELNQSHKNIEQIAQYCKNAYSTEADQNAVLEKTQNYIKDALANVAYHIHTVGLIMTNSLQLQATEIEKLDLQLQTLSDRLKAAHDTTGVAGLRTMETVRPYKPKPKMQKLEGEELPPNARPLAKYVRRQLDLKALDNVGIDLSGHKGTGSFNSSLPPTTLQAPPAPSPSLGGAAAAPPPPRMEPPPPVGHPPPPPMEIPPPPMEMPPPPPPMDTPVADDLPPPPPPMDFDDVPPPPPPRD